MAAQLINTMDKDQPQIREEINKANYEPLLNWLKTNIHQHGRRYTRNELTREKHR